jgi:hypothetical protein
MQIIQISHINTNNSLNARQVKSTQVNPPNTNQDKTTQYNSNKFPLVKLIYHKASCREN